MHFRAHFSTLHFNEKFQIELKTLEGRDQEGEEEEEANKQEGGRKGETRREEEVRGRRAEMEESSWKRNDNYKPIPN